MINPKAVTAEELFGHMDAAKEWCDNPIRAHTYTHTPSLHPSLARARALPLSLSLSLTHTHTHTHHLPPPNPNPPHTHTHTHRCDGVLSIIMRNMKNNVAPYSAQMKHKWMVCVCVCVCEYVWYIVCSCECECVSVRACVRASPPTPPK